MNRLDDCFAKLKEQGEKALISFFTTGAPDLLATKQLILAAQKQGTDIIELGVPFTDPMAAGSAVRLQNAQSIEQGVCLEDVFELVSSVRKESQIPIVLFVYYNSLLHYQAQRFFKRCQASGVDAIAMPDLPFEESDEIFSYMQQYGVYHILPISPTSHERMADISSRAKGFLHCVAAFKSLENSEHSLTCWENFLSTVGQTCKLPIVVGLDMFSPEEIAKLRAFCDGGIVEDKIAQTIVQANSAQEAVRDVEQVVECMARQLGKAID